MWVIITQDGCSYCDKVKELLLEKEQNHFSYNLSSSSNKWLLTLMKKANLKTVPQVFKPDGSLVGGYTELKELLTEGPL